MRPVPLLLTALLLFLVGCRASDVVEVRDWTVERGATRAAVTVPTHIQGLPKAPEHYALRTTIALPPAFRGHALRLAVPSLAAVTELHVPAYGPEAIRSDDGVEPPYRGRLAHVWTIPARATASPTLDVVLEVDHAWTQGGWVDAVPRLGLASVPDTSFELRRGVTDVGNVVALATLLPTGFSYLVLWLLDRRRRWTIWLSIQSFTGSILPLFATGITAALFGRLDVPILGVSQFIAPYAAIRFTYATFDLGKPPRALTWLVLGGFVASAIWHSPFDGLEHAFAVVGAITLLHGFHLVTLARLARPKDGPPNARLLLAGWSFIGLATMAEGPVWLGQGAPIGGIRVGSWGLIVISVVQMIVLVRDYVAERARAERLNHDLQEKVAHLETRQRENEVLNEELRRQIAERSEALSCTLARFSQLDSAPVLAPGELVDGRWRVSRAIGAGGMGTVFEVERMRDARMFALKVMKGDPAPLKLARFAREAQLGARIAHRNVVGIVDVQVSARGFLYLVMDLVRGRSLEAHRDRYGDLRFALDVLGQVADGLVAIHAVGVVHRDLKPSNILVERETGVVRITDFGISRRTTIGDQSTSDGDITVPPPNEANHALLADPFVDLTKTGAVIGTPKWHAPELASGSAAGPAADVYGLGLLAVLLVTGTRPGDAREAARLLGDLVSPELASLLVRSLALEPRVRPTAMVLAEAFKTEERRVFPAERAS